MGNSNRLVARGQNLNCDRSILKSYLDLPTSTKIIGSVAKNSNGQKNSMIFRLYGDELSFLRKIQRGVILSCVLVTPIRESSYVTQSPEISV
jgi:hypothetical protein